MEQFLLRLLDRLERVGLAHEEIYATEVREQMSSAVFEGFIRRNPDYILPDNFGLYCEHANHEVRSALAEYIALAASKADELGLRTAHDRLAAFQNREVQTTGEGNFYDDFFGYSPAESLDDGEK